MTNETKDVLIALEILRRQMQGAASSGAEPSFEDAFIEKYLAREGESLADARARLMRNQTKEE